MHRNHAEIITIKLGQIKYLLDIYHRRKSNDLNSNIKVDDTRKKGLFRQSIPFFKSSSIVAKIEKLVKKIESSGLRNDDPLPDFYQCNNLFDINKIFSIF